MEAASTRTASRKWDIARVWDEGPAGRAAWAESYACRAFGGVLTQLPEFWTQVDEVRSGLAPADVARRYVRRNQGGRVEAVACFFERAAEAEAEANAVKLATWTTGLRAWFVGAEAEPGTPQRNLRADAVETIAYGAYRVARRGAGRCASPVCPGGRVGTKLGSHNASGYCSACDVMDARPSTRLEAERTFFDALVPAVLGGEYRPRARRLRRAA